jgi:hypothetical protein
MTAQKDFETKVSEIVSEWNKAEESIKIAEQIGHKVVFPAVKELRYAGRRIVDAIDAKAKGEPKKALEYLVDAHFNCFRSRHDAIDATISTIAIELETITKKIGHSATIQAYPNFHKLNAAIIQAHTLVVSSRGKRDSREEVYGTVRGIPFTEIVRDFREFKANYKVMKSLARRERWSKVGFWIMLVLTILSVMAGWPTIKTLPPFSFIF